jgi:all-trans-retinol dehydrogenase (NAD+)
MPLIKPAEAAAAIISAQRKGLQEASIPRYLFHQIKFARIFPNTANVLIKSFMEADVEADD